jgi:hypothetical protein
MRGCETCRYNFQTEEDGRYDDVCSHLDHPGVQSDWTFLNGCSDWKSKTISWKCDENCYQPKIHSEKIRQLYAIKEETGIPMTVLLDMAIEEFVGYHRS